MAQNKITSIFARIEVLNLRLVILGAAILLLGTELDTLVAQVYDDCNDVVFLGEPERIVIFASWLQRRGK